VTAAPRARAAAARAVLLAGGLAVALVLAEAALALLGLPRWPVPRSAPPQFELLPMERGHERESPLYVNARSRRIRFVYADDPRGYFGPENAVDHYTNRLGFRGGYFEPTKPEGVRRIVFLGDSFTFGEGVRREDTYPERTAAILNQRADPGAERIQSLNLGVGGYDTTQAWHLFEQTGLALSPDAVVLGYVLNDAEPPLYELDLEAGVLRPRPRATSPGGIAATPPERGLYRLRIARLVWQVWEMRARARRLVEHTRRLYAPDGAGWQESRRAIEALAARCREHGLPLTVLIFPLLFQLDDYPFDAVHERVGAAASRAGAAVVDLLPQLRGRDAAALWVHPTDPHPNERVHALAAQVLADHLERRMRTAPLR
jgi:hypothetical protein